MKENLNEFLENFKDYAAQPNVYVLIVYHLDNSGYEAICYVALTEYEAVKWTNEYPGEGLGRKYFRLLLYKEEK